jgi:hypothetical protein
MGTVQARRVSNAFDVDGLNGANSADRVDDAAESRLLGGQDVTLETAPTALPR